MEGKDDQEIINFLESSSSSHISTTDPTAKNTKRKRTEELFTKNEEGKYVFEEPPVEKPKKNQDRKACH